MSNLSQSYDWDPLGGENSKNSAALNCHSAERVVCDACFIRRADFETPCGHNLHVRCIFQLPLLTCPICNANISDSKEGIRILPVEPHGTVLVSTSVPRGTDLRTGRWHNYETLYAQHIIADFESGTLPIGEGTKLSSLLCRILNCNPTRLSKKLRIGKRFYTHCPSRVASTDSIREHQIRQRRISELEELFLMAEGQSVRGGATAPLLSERMQTEWRERFVGHAHTMGQKLKDAWSWNSTRRNNNDSAALTKLLTTMGPPVGVPNGAEGTGTGLADFAVSPHVPLFLVQHTANDENQNNSSNGYNYQTNKGTHKMELYPTASNGFHCNDTHSEYCSHLFHQHLLMTSPTHSNNDIGSNWNLKNKSDMAPKFNNVNVPRDVWANLGDNLLDIGQKNSLTLNDNCGKMFLEYPWALPENNQVEDLFIDTEPVEDGNASAECSSSCMDIESYNNSPSVNDEDCDKKYFEDFIGNFLKQVPFEAVDVWVPFSREGNASLVLYHAGYYTDVEELKKWGVYSTQFAFHRNEGLPGRVFEANSSEFQENVHNLNKQTFLRLDGALENGIRTTFGVPVVSKKGVTFVIVFYSRSTVHVDPKLQNFIESTVKAWRFDATYEV